MTARKVIRSLLVFIIAATAIATIASLAFNRRDASDSSHGTTKNSATLSLDKVHHTASRQGVDEWSIDAKTVNLYSSENRAQLKGLTARYFEKSGTVTTMVSDEGSLDTVTRDMKITGNVVITRGPLTIRTEALTYSKREQVIVSDTAVELSDGISILTGDTMTLDLKTSHMELVGHVKGTIREESTQQGTIVHP